MAYTPINAQAFVSSYAGAVAGMGASGWLVNSSQSAYADVTQIAGAFAQAFDQAWNNPAQLNSLEFLTMAVLVAQDFQQRGPGPLSKPEFKSRANWARAAAACVAAILQSDAYMAGQGVTPPAVAGYSVLVNGLPIPNEPAIDFVGCIGGVQLGANVIFFWTNPSPQFNPGDNVQLSPGQQIGEAHTAIGPVTFTMPQGNFVFPGMPITVIDSDGNAAVNNITVVDVLGNQIEDPALPGSYSPGITLHVNNLSASWVLTTDGKWKCTSYFH